MAILNLRRIFDMKYNIENRIKDTAIVNLTDFENAIDLYEEGEIEKALELMFGITVLGLGGDFETDDREVRRLLRNREYTVAKSNKTYCNKVYSKEVGQRAKLQLDDIVEMMANGATQQVIADSLSVSLDTIKYRVRIMKENFPSLYAESVAKAQTQGVKKCNKVGVSGSNGNDNDNDNDNVNGNVNDNDNVNGNVLENSTSNEVSSPASSEDETEQQNQEEDDMKMKVVPFPVPAELERKRKKINDIELLLQGVDLEALDKATTDEEAKRALGF